MAGALRKTMVYLGLAEDDERYDDEYDERLRRARRSAEEHAPSTAVPRSRRCRPAHAGGARRARRRRRSALNRITTIHPRTYNEAKTIGESFRDGTPVIMNLTDMDDADAKRLVDFAAGLVFGLHGSIERVTNKVFLLSPAHVEVDAEDGPAVPGRSVFNQS